MTENVLDRIALTGIVPVLTIQDAARAVPTVQAILAGGIDAVEIAFRTPAAAESIARAAREVPEMLVGAGTVLSLENAEEAVAAGARFLVAPGFNPKVAGWCCEHGVPFIPGCSTASEIEAAREMGYRRLKFFPAASAGGVATLHDFAGPYTDVSFMATGGITPENLSEFLAQKNVYAVGGGWLASPAAIAAGDWAQITANCRSAVRRMHGFALQHVGINTASAAEGERVAKLLSAMFDLPLEDRPDSCFVGSGFEVMKQPGLGTNGHIAIACNDVGRAAAWLEKQGFAFRSEGRVEDASGLVCLYLRSEIAGFALHLRRR